MYVVLKECTQKNKDGMEFARFFPGEKINLPKGEANRLMAEGAIEVYETASKMIPEKRGRGRPRKRT